VVGEAVPVEIGQRVIEGAVPVEVQPDAVQVAVTVDVDLGLPVHIDAPPAPSPRQ
jgi:hypothetical protein